MIEAVLVINTDGKPRLTQFYKYHDTNTQQKIINSTFQKISKRSLHASNFIRSENNTTIYRQYATLYFCFIVSNESILSILDTIQVFVEALDSKFVNVCELDLIFRPDDCFKVLGEIVCGGLVLNINVESISGLDVSKTAYFHR